MHAFEVEFELSFRLGGATQDTVHLRRRQAREQAMSAMERYVSRIALPPALIWPAVTRGYPPRVIVDGATRAGAELVVVGKHAAGIIERLLIGSVALQVLERAQCDVLAVPERVA